MTTSANRYFTSQFRARNRLIASVAIVLASVAPFAAGLIAIEYLISDPRGPLALAVVAAAFATAGGLTWMVQNRLALVGNAWLRSRLEAELYQREEYKMAQWVAPPVFVGFAPGRELLSWEGETDLDVGFVCLSPDSLVFIGDRFTWALARERIGRIELSPAIGPRRIIIHWHAPREPRRALALSSRQARSLAEAEASTIALFRTLRKWSVVASGGEGTPVVLGLPPTSDYGGRPLDEIRPDSCVAVLAMAVIMILTAWYLVSEMLQDGFYYHAVLWAGFVLVGGAVFTRCLLHYLHSVGPPRPRRKVPPR